MLSEVNIKHKFCRKFGMWDKDQFVCRSLKKLSFSNSGQTRARYIEEGKRPQLHELEGQIDRRDKEKPCWATPREAKSFGVIFLYSKLCTSMWRPEQEHR
jgi:hypothetical protein